MTLRLRELAEAMESAGAAARVETRLLAAFDQIGLSQDLQKILLLQGFDDRTNIDVGASHEHIEKVGDIHHRWSCGRGRG